MKRIGLKIVVIAFLAIVVSCGKTTKGKLENEWEVVEYEVKQDQDNGGGVIAGSVEMMKDGVYHFSQYSNNGPNGELFTEETNGTLVEHTFKIEKNGKWSRYCHYILPQEIEMILEAKGTWSFVGKSKEEAFAKNERILFNWLENKSTTIYPGSDPEGTINYTKYLVGQLVEIFKVIESKKNELILQADFDVTSENVFQNYQTKGYKKFILKTK